VANCRTDMRSGIPGDAGPSREHQSLNKIIKLSEQSLLSGQDWLKFHTRAKVGTAVATHVVTLRALCGDRSRQLIRARRVLIVCCFGIGCERGIPEGSLCQSTFEYGVAVAWSRQAIRTWCPPYIAVMALLVTGTMCLLCIYVSPSDIHLNFPPTLTPTSPNPPLSPTFITPRLLHIRVSLLSNLT
jgi:hypothetical protein